MNLTSGSGKVRGNSALPLVCRAPLRARPKLFESRIGIRNKVFRECLRRIQESTGARATADYRSYAPEREASHSNAPKVPCQVSAAPTA